MSDIQCSQKGEMIILTPKESASILLTEYSSLRTEIMARTTNMYQLFAAGIAVLLYVFTHLSNWSTAAVAITSILFGGGFTWLIDRDIRKAARRLREIENDVNRRVGEELLVWESRWGGAISGFFGPAIPLTREQAEAGINEKDDFPWVGKIVLAVWRLIKHAVISVHESLGDLRRRQKH